MAIFRGIGGAGEAETDATITALTQLANQAQASATAAAASATAAANSVSQQVLDLGLTGYTFSLSGINTGDLIHQIHPLAGQGFNMTIRDIFDLSEIIDSKLSLGLELNSSIFSDFDKKTKHKNYIFSQGIDLIYNFFDNERKLKGKFFSQTLKYLGANKYFNNIITKIADEGITY